MSEKIRKVKITITVDEDIYRKLVTMSFESKLKGNRKISVSELINDALREKYGATQ